MPSTSTETTPNIEDDLELDSIANHGSNDCENCQLNKAKIVQLQKKVSRLKKKRAELYAEIEQVFLSSNVRNGFVFYYDTHYTPAYCIPANHQTS